MPHHPTLTSPSQPPTPPTHPRSPVSVLVAFFPVLCSLIFQQLQEQSNGPFKLPASCICKKKKKKCLLHLWANVAVLRLFLM